jgi:hypothetical protein
MDWSLSNLEMLNIDSRMHISFYFPESEREVLGKSTVCKRMNDWVHHE